MFRPNLGGGLYLGRNLSYMVSEMKSFFFLLSFFFFFPVPFCQKRAKLI